MMLRDKWGWPMERIIGRWFSNFIRTLLHTSIRVTWARRNQAYWRCTGCSGVSFEEQEILCRCGGEKKYHGPLRA